MRFAHTPIVLPAVDEYVHVLTPAYPFPPLSPCLPLSGTLVYGTWQLIGHLANESIRCDQGTDVLMNPKLVALAGGYLNHKAEYQQLVAQTIGFLCQRTDRLLFVMSSQPSVLYKVAALCGADHADVQCAALHAVACILSAPRDRASVGTVRILVSWMAGRSASAVTRKASSSASQSQSPSGQGEQRSGQGDAPMLPREEERDEDVQRHLAQAVSLVHSVATRIEENSRYAAMHVLASVALHPWGVAVLLQAAGLMEFLLDRSTITAFGKLEADWKFKILSTAHTTCMTVRQSKESRELDAVAPSLLSKVQAYTQQGAFHTDRVVKVMDPVTRLIE